MKTILLRKNQERRIKAGHPWVFSNEIWKMPERLYPGEDVQVSDSRGHLIGSGFYNPHSLISVRIYSRERREFDRELIKERLKQADDLRQRFYPGSKFYRLCYGESDGLPGLIIDRYDRQLVLEIMSLGTDCRKEFVVESLREQFDPECIYERSDSYSRKLEGLTPAIGELYGRLRPEVTLEENGLKFWRRPDARPEDRLVLRPTGQPGGPASLRQGPDGAGLLLPHRRLCHKCGGRRSLRGHRDGYIPESAIGDGREECRTSTTFRKPAGSARPM